MSFQSLKVGELKELAEFYTVEPKVADEEHGPTKKELLAALAEAEVSDEDYDTFVEAKAAGTDKTDEQRPAESAEPTEAEEEQEGAAESDEEVEEDAEKALETAEEQDDPEDEVLVKMIRKNGTYEAFGYRFLKEHPFKAVPASIAERLVEEEEGFRLALPSEVKDYYN